MLQRQSSPSAKAAFRAYTEATFSHFPTARFEDVRAYASPRGLAARYRGSWQSSDGTGQHLSGAVIFRFANSQISEIGVQLNGERLRQLVAARQTR
jgi:predicted ester cyclase